MDNLQPLAPDQADSAQLPLKIRTAPEALCCIDEDDLDNWWSEQDVEVKADAFLRWALDRTTSYIYCGEPGIPALGTAGETPERWA